MDVSEPPEPDNILWKNLEYDTVMGRTLPRSVGPVITIGLLVVSYFIVNQSHEYSTIVLSIVVTILDKCLCLIFGIVTDLGKRINDPLVCKYTTTIINLENCHDEAQYQASLQIKLFGVRLLLSSIFPYLSIGWNKFLSKDVLTKILSVQISACFADPLLDLVDVYGHLMRFVIGPMFVKTQSYMNKLWTGRKWKLAGEILIFIQENSILVNL